MSVNSKTMFRKFAAMLLALTVLLSSMAPAYAELAYTNKKATIYVQENGKMKKAGTAAKGTAVTILDTNGDWALVEKDGKQAYMKLAELAADEAEKDGSSNKVTKCQKTVYVAVEGAKVYEADSAASTELTTMAKGAKLTMTAYSDNWCLVKSGDTVGFMKRSELSLDKVEAKTEKEETVASVTKCKKTVYVSVDSAKVYKSASDSASVLDTLKKGQKLTMTAYDGTWALVKSGSKSGYMKQSELSLEKVEVKAEEETEATVTKCKKTVYVSADSAKVYKSASELSDVLDTLTMGQKLTMTAYDGTWALVKSGSKSGYMKQSELSLEKVEVPAEDDGITKCDKNSYAIEDGVKVYKKADAGSKVLATLTKNQVVNVVAYSDTWYQVKNGKTTGYVQMGKLSDSKIVEMPSELRYGDTGDAVKQLQQRLKDLGYFTGTVAGNYLDQTRNAVMLFQSQNDLDIDGTAGPKTLSKLFSDKAEKYDPDKVVKDPVKENTGESTASPASGKSIEMDWWTSNIQSIFSRGTTAVVTDVSTGISWKEKRTGGTNHADVQPVTAADTAAMKKACGSWSWERRAVWVSINGQKYAASMNCMPHGSGSITTNNFDGHHCIHFTNSRTHGTNSVCPLHQAAIKKALSKG